MLTLPFFKESILLDYYRVFGGKYRINETMYSGIIWFDGENNQLIACINLFDLGIRINNQKTIDYSVKEIKRCITKHFAHEERMMTYYRYPKKFYEEHIDSHKRFWIKFNEINAFEEKQTKQSNKELFDFLKEWIFNHSEKYDMKLTAFMKP